MDRLPEAWIAPPATRQLREQVRHRAKLVALRSGLKASVHAVLAKEGVPVAMSDLFGVAGQAMLDELRLGPAYAERVASLRRLIDAVTLEIDMVGRRVSAQLDVDRGYRAVQALEGWVRCWRRCSWPRSGRSPAAPGRRSCARGPG